MKIQSKLALMVSLAAFAASPLAMAGKDAPAVEPAAPDVTEEVETEVVIEEPVAETEEPSTGTEEPADGGGEVVDSGGKDTEVELSDPTPETTGSGKDGGEVPIDWVKRGDGDNPEIFYNMAGGEAPVFKGETARELGQDDKAAAIETKGAAAAPIKGEKKEPVALIKKGRVFLR